MPWVLAIIAALFLAIALKRAIDWALAATIVSGFASMAFLVWAVGRYNLKRAQAVVRSDIRSTPSTRKDFRSTLTELEELKARALELAASPRPRPVSMTARGRFHLMSFILVMALLTILIWVFAHDRSGQLVPFKVWLHDSGGLLVLLICVATAFGFFLRNRLRERALLSYGEVATGKVFGQLWSRYPGLWTNRSVVRYSFKDASGRTFESQCTDTYRLLFPGMLLIVFYDLSHPERSVGLECSLYDVGTQPSS